MIDGQGLVLAPGFIDAHSHGDSAIFDHPDALAAVGVVPHLLVGDFDSVSDEARRDLAARGVETVILPTAKDETDTEVALRLAVDRGAESITVFGALGGPRLDHLLGVVALLAADWLRGVDVRLVDHLQEVYLADGDRSIEGEPGDLVSLLPLTFEVRDIHTEGLLYPLRGEALRQGQARGVSNELVGRRARVRHGAGHLLVTHFRGARGAGVASATSGEDR